MSSAQLHNHERFLRNVEERIDSADREMKQKAENTLKVTADNYHRLLSDRLANELGMIDESEATGNAPAAQHHRVLAEVSGQYLTAGRKSGPLKTRLIASFFMTADASATL